MEVLVQALVTASISSFAVVAVAADLGPTHSTNPLWVGHARFHVVWQVATHLGMGVLATVLVWAPVGPLGIRVVTSMVITAVVLLGFGVAAVAMGLYGGEIADANGYRPIRIGIGDRRWDLDQNVLLFFTAAILLAVAVVITGGFSS